MFKKNSEKYPNLDAAIERVMDDMSNADPQSEQYSSLLRSLERLHALKAPSQPRGVSRDVVWQTVGYVVGVLVIVSYEHGHVMASKALQQLKKP